MEARFQLTNPDRVQATMEVTMTIEQWREVLKSLPNHWPHWEFGAKIRNMISAAEAKFCERMNDTGGR